MKSNKLLYDMHVCNLCLPAKVVKNRGDITFDDDKDDLMDALGIDRDRNSASKKETALWSNKER